MKKSLKIQRSAKWCLSEPAHNLYTPMSNPSLVSYNALKLSSVGIG